MSEKYTVSPKTYQEALSIQCKRSPQIWVSGKGSNWRNATQSEVISYFNPANTMTGNKRYQHMILSKPVSITADQINNYLKGNGVLEGHGSAFIQAGNTYNVNPIYLAYHAKLETGNGTSALAKGTVSGYSGYYNVYGINAYDSNPLIGGASWAKSHGWDTIDKAIIGGAQFVRENYINRGQDTLYKMRWNPANPGTHQYATDVNWANQQANAMATVISKMGVTNIDYDYPVYNGSTVPPTVEAQGTALITEAKKHLGKKYSKGTSGPDTFDNVGYIKYVYKTVLNIDLPDDVRGLSSKGNTIVNTSELKAGDLIFFSMSPCSSTYSTAIDDPTPMPKLIGHVAMMTGNGMEFIHCSGTDVSYGSLDTPHIKSYYITARRLISTVETSNTGYTYDFGNNVSTSGTDSTTGLAGGLPLTNVNRYYDDMISALEELKEKGWDKGTLVDLTNDGSFEFYLPNDITANNNVNYESSSVKGRSAPLQGYETTGPRSVDVSLTLAAGIKPYDTGDMVEKMHKDINFVESLLYPDYSSAYVLPPAMVLLSLGPDVRIKGVMTNFSKNYKAPLDKKGRYMICDISFTITQVTDDPPDYTDIRNATPRSY